MGSCISREDRGEQTVGQKFNALTRRHRKVHVFVGASILVSLGSIGFRSSKENEDDEEYVRRAKKEQISRTFYS